MSWIVFPKQCSDYLSNNGPLRRAFVAALTKTPRTATLFRQGEIDLYTIDFIPQPSDVTLAIITRSDAESIVMAGAPLLSIWADSYEAGVWALNDDDSCQVLERMCQLAQRAWDNLSLPEQWWPKRVENFHTIFAGDERLQDVRFAYAVRNEGEHKIVEIGSVFIGRRSSKPLMVPAPPDEVIAALPKHIVAQNLDNSNASVVDERDLQIQRIEGEGRNLFSLSFPDWVSDKGPLTRQQRRVISHGISRPLRIHGPAGSGKTLVLMLKALSLIRNAQDKGEICHCLIVANNTAVRNTIRAALETIDDRGFLATSKRDPQFLDVETLHGWCIRELGLEDGPRYVLHADPLASREQQDKILYEIVDEAIREKYPKMTELLSSDLMARLNGDRDKLIGDFRYEIAIRIKGRGYRRSDGDLFVRSQFKTFVGGSENPFDRRFIFHVYTLYEEHFERVGLLDTDDVVLSMGARLSTSLWSRQRRSLGYDFILVDETHLFNENERRVFPYLTRGITDSLPLVMTFDEAQTIGGRRSLDLDSVGIQNSEKKSLTYVHRSSPEIFALARELMERSPLLFSEFESTEGLAQMSERERKKSAPPAIVYCRDDSAVVSRACSLSNDFRARNYSKVGIISFSPAVTVELSSILTTVKGPVHVVRERGEMFAAVPGPGVYLMTPEVCGGLEFDAVILIGADEGRVPRVNRELSPEGYLSVQEEAFKELYTAITRARYRLVFVSNEQRGISSILSPSISAGLIGVREVAKG